MTPMRLVIALSVLALGGCVYGSSESSPVAEVASGMLRGTSEGGIHAFKGIPYAEPPVGELRWTAPKSPEAWTGVRDATEFRPDCIQPPVPEESIYYDPPVSSSEDCLSLNVWAPEGVKSAPVIVWLHGGSLRIGGSSLRLYDGTNFAQRGAVFVSINYRLGILGWLAHRELSEESAEGISGNYGLLDQIAALRWIRENIAVFGGDPDNVTVMGESAGALSVTYLLTSAIARGLFAKAIIQSTNLRAFPELGRAAHGLPSAEGIGARTLAKLGLAHIAEARAMDAQSLTDLAAMQGFPAQGTIDGKVLPRQLIDTFDRREQAAVPVLVGFNSHEVRTQRGLLPSMPEDAAAYGKAIGRAYGDLAPEFLRLYPALNGEDSLIDAASHGIYGWSGERIVRSQQELGLDSYLYVFDHCYPSANARGLCGFHASELPFAFGNLDTTSLPARWPAPDGAQDRRISRAMLDYWLSFAAAGEPVSGGNAEWHAYGSDEHYLRFRARPEADRDPYPGMFELHEAFNQRQREEGKPWGIVIGLAADPERNSVSTEGSTN